MAQVHYSTDYLLTVIPQICREANPDDPSTVTQREFDRARSKLDIECPKAANLVVRFNMPWGNLVSLGLGDDPGTFQAARRAEQGSENQISFDDVTAVAAVRAAAKALGQETLLPHEYTAHRNQVLHGTRGIKRQRLTARWPVEAQIKKRGWNEILIKADLETTEVNQIKGVENPDAMELHLECRGFVPTVNAAIEFLRSHGVSARRKNMSTDEALQILRQRRESEGKWTPARTLRNTDRPEIPDECLAIEKERLAPYQAANTPRPRNWWTSEERILDGLKLAISKLEPGESLTQKNLRRLAKENRGQIPSQNTVTEFAKRNGTNLPELRARAIRDLRSNAK